MQGLRSQHFFKLKLMFLNQENEISGDISDLSVDQYSQFGPTSIHFGWIGCAD